jgi:GT2 family glycosyltransferase
MDKVKLPAVPETRDELMIAALRHANEVGDLLNEVGREVSRVLGETVDDPKYDRLHELLRQRFAEHSALHLFIGAHNLGLALPQDLRGETEEEEE